jgi:NADPH2:quinone reductase
MRHRAIRMRETGPPTVLVEERVDDIPLAPGEIRVEVSFAAVNHTDLEIRRGAWKIRRPDPFPYVPGVELVGRIVEIGRAVTGFALDDAVVTMMQGLGGVRAERPGAYQDRVVVAAKSVVRVPNGVGLEAMAAVGLPGITARQGLEPFGPIARRKVAVSGASGGVGSLAVGIARARGAEVTAIVTSDRRVEYARSLGASTVISLEAGPLGAQLAPGSVDCVVDTVGGPLFPDLVAALKPGGCLSLVGAVAGGDVRFDAWNLLGGITLTGWSSEALDGEELEEAVDSLGAMIRTKALALPRVTRIGLVAASAAHALLERRGVEGRILLVP